MRYLLIIFIWSSISFILPAQSSNIVNNGIDSTSSEKVSSGSTFGFFKLFKGKPGKAALFSLILPGGGQLYNRKYLKSAVIMGVEGFLVYRVLFYSRAYNESKEGYIDLSNDKISAYKGLDSADKVKSYRDLFQTQKENAWIYLIGFHLLNVIEAFVDQHLMAYDISEDLSIDILQDKIYLGDHPHQLVGVQMSYRF